MSERETKQRSSPLFLSVKVTKALTCHLDGSANRDTRVTISLFNYNGYIIFGSKSAQYDKL